MQITSGASHRSDELIESLRHPLTSQERTMWQVHAAFRLGEYKTREIDLTPMIGVSSVMAVFLLILQNS
jgi:hypothetical protein